MNRFKRVAVTAFAVAALASTMAWDAGPRSVAGLQASIRRAELACALSFALP
jgi:hypothetical protein